MRRTTTYSLACILLMKFMLPLDTHAVAGKWMPEQILEHDPAWLKELGLEIDPRQLWNPEEGGGLLAAVVQFNGCSSGFVSAQGLILTNHHCAFGLLQEHSTPENDLITHGFLASDRADELPGTGVRATVPHRFIDVTDQITAAIPAKTDDLERFRAIDRKKKELVQRCEAQPFRRCRVATYDDGARYVLIEALEFRDVRLVYAPPRAVGEYGGEIDNWMWPRHTGDFTLLRVYANSDNQPAEHAVANRPYRPKRPLQIAHQGIEAGDFVMVVGYPFLTYRSLVADEMAERAELFFPRRTELYQTWIDLMRQASEQDPDAAIRLAGRIKGLLNREKNSRGQIKGIERGNLLEKKRRLEDEVLAWAAKRPEHRAAIAAYQQLGEMVQETRETTWEGDFLLTEIERGSGPLDLFLAVELVRWASERQKPDLERLEDYQERDREQFLADHKRHQKRLHPATDRALLEDLLTRLANLPESQRVPAVEVLLSDRSATGISKAVDGLLKGSRVHDLDARLEIFEESVPQLRARRDPLLDFALALNADLQAKLDHEQRHEGAVSRLRPTWREALQAFLDRPLDPDANGTLRVSLAHVRGYQPRDAVFMEPLTSLGGLVEKHTGEDPFDAPDKILEAAPQAQSSRWASPQLEDVPIGFLATGDTTGGSSGSPVLNGRGELVGLNFDRVWENIANDFGYNPDIARNVSVDVRYLLWMLDDIENARHLLEELGLGKN